MANYVMISNHGLVIKSARGNILVIKHLKMSAEIAIFKEYGE